MTRHKHLVGLALVVTLAQATPARAQLTGTYGTLDRAGSVTTLTLRESADAELTGLLTLDGETYRIEGLVEGEIANGTATGRAGTFLFEADRWGWELRLVLYPVGADGAPVYDAPLELVLFEGGVGPGFAPGNPLRPRPGAPLGRDGRGGDSFVGTHTDGEVTLRLQGSAGRYSGLVTIRGEVFGVTATVGAYGLEGTIDAPDGAYPVTIQAIAGGLVLASDGVEHVLRPGSGAGYGQAPGGAGVPPVRPAPGRRLGASIDHPLAREWARALTGSRLALTSEGLGSALARGSEVHLCTDGSFLVRAPRPTAGRRPGGASGSLAEGPTWYVVSDGRATTLVLESAEGRAQEHDLAVRDGVTHLDGVPAEVAATGLCR